MFRRQFDADSHVTEIAGWPRPSLVNTHLQGGARQDGVLRGVRRKLNAIRDTFLKQTTDIRFQMRTFYKHFINSTPPPSSSISGQGKCGRLTEASGFFA